VVILPRGLIPLASTACSSRDDLLAFGCIGFVEDREFEKKSR
jgi:hypothetical protein